VYVPIIELTTYVGAPQDLCFDQVLNVDIQVQLDTHTRVVDGITSGPLRCGDWVTWRAVHFGLPWRMTSEIVEVDRPLCFIDAMRHGPFARWRHTHRFEPLGGGTLIHDHVSYQAPLGLVGRLFDEAVLQRYLTGLLASRNQRFKHIMESGSFDHSDVMGRASL
jgi:ligand-binding SRPBCC domain-containing protein